MLAETRSNEQNVAQAGLAEGHQTTYALVD